MAKNKLNFDNLIKVNVIKINHIYVHFSENEISVIKIFTILVTVSRF